MRAVFYCANSVLPVHAVLLYAGVGTTLSVILAANSILFFSFRNNAENSGVHSRVQVDVRFKPGVHLSGLSLD